MDEMGGAEGLGPRDQDHETQDGSERPGCGELVARVVHAVGHAAYTADGWLTTDRGRSAEWNVEGSVNVEHVLEDMVGASGLPANDRRLAREALDFLRTHETFTPDAVPYRWQLVEAMERYGSALSAEAGEEAELRAIRTETGARELGMIFNYGFWNTRARLREES